MWLYLWPLASEVSPESISTILTNICSILRAKNILFDLKIFHIIQYKYVSIIISKSTCIISILPNTVLSRFEIDLVIRSPCGRYDVTEGPDVSE